MYLSPVLPKLSAAVAEFLNTPALMWADASNTLPAGHAINKYTHLMQRIEPEQIDKLIENNKQAVADAKAAEEKAAKAADFEPVAETCSFDDFMKVDLRVAKVLNCEKVEGSSKLLKFSLDLGFEERTIFSGIAASYPEPEKLIGRMVVVVANFAPRKMAKFGMSEGMITSAANKDHSQLFLLDVDTGAKAGMKIG